MRFNAGIEVTKRCNFRCRHCFVDAGRAREYEMSTAELEAVIAGLARFGAQVIGWSGGEPLLRQDLVHLTAFAKTHDLDVGLATNGFLATKEHLAKLKEAGLSLVQVSIDGPTEDKAERWRQGPKNAFERAKEAVANASALGLTAYVCTLFAPDTAPELEEMIALAQSLGAYGIRYTMWAPVGRAGEGHYDEAAWSTPQVSRFLTKLQRLNDEAGYPVSLDCPTGPLPWRRQGCTAGTHTAYITADGDLYPCTALMTEQYRVGNLCTEPLESLLKSDRMVAIHHQLKDSLPGGACSDCVLLETCRGGCPGRTLAADGDIRNGDHQGAMPVCLFRLHR